MATLTNADYTKIKEWVSGQTNIKAELRSWALSRPVLQAAIQAVETYMVNGFTTRPATSIKAAIEAETGATTSTRAQYIFVIWVSWKLNNFLGG